jgi:hypothetical protein
MSAPPASQHIPLKEIDDEHILKKIDDAVTCQWTFNSQGSHPLVTLLERTNKIQGEGWLRKVVHKGSRKKNSRFSSEEKGYLKLLGSKIPESVVGRLKTLLGFAWGSTATTMKKYLGDPIRDPSLYDECEASCLHAAEVVESLAGSETLAESRGIEVEVEGDDSNDESLEAVATTVTPTPQANTRSFFGREVNELDRLALVGGCCNKDDEELLDTYGSDDADDDDFNLQLPDEDEADDEQEEEPDEELEPSLGETSDTADPNRSIMELNENMTSLTLHPVCPPPSS